MALTFVSPSARSSLSTTYQSTDQSPYQSPCQSQRRQSRQGVLVDPWFLEAAEEELLAASASARPLSQPVSEPVSQQVRQRLSQPVSQAVRRTSNSAAHPARGGFSMSALVTGAVAVLMMAMVLAALTTRAGAASADRVWVVAEGESLWGIARELQPTGDVRPLVEALTVIHGTSAVRPGDEVLIPSHLSYASE
jgi:hypothetical protein